MDLRRFSNDLFCVFAAQGRPSRSPQHQCYILHVIVNKPKSSRNSFGEIDHSVIGRALATHGFISADATWPVLSDDQRQQILVEKGLGGSDRFVESPEFKQQRIREMRRARRARRAAKTANA